MKRIWQLFGWVLVACSTTVVERPPKPLPREKPTVPVAPAPAEDAPPPLDKAPPAHIDARVPVRADDPSWGQHDAPVTLVMFGSFQCAPCTKLKATLAGLKTKYGPHQLRVVWKDFPREKSGEDNAAHAAARAVYQLGGNDAFWRFHDLAYADGAMLTAANLETWAVSAGAPLADYQALVRSEEIAARVVKGYQDGKTLSVRGAPTAFINGVPVAGLQTPAKFEGVIDDQLKAAAALVGARVAPVQVYVELANKNYVEPPKRAPEDTVTVWKVPIHKDDPVKGNKDALITIVEWADFQCPYCRKSAATMDQLLVDYGDKLRVVWKDHPLAFHKRAMPAAIAGREVYTQLGSEGFWDIHDLMMQSQKQLEDADLLGYATEANANTQKLKVALTKATGLAAIERSQLLADDLEVRGTPTFFVNGRRMTGAQPIDAFKVVIDEEIPLAETALANGVVPAQLYDELIKNGKEPPPLEKKLLSAVPADAPFKGGKFARVVIQLFGDFEDGLTRKTATTLDAILTRYGNKVKLVWRHNPLPVHRQASLAHQAAIEAYVQKGNAGFWAMHDKLLAHPSKLGAADLDTYASEIGLDVLKFREALSDRRHEQRMANDVSAAKSDGVDTAPFVTINGYLLPGSRSELRLRHVIDLALKKP